MTDPYPIDYDLTGYLETAPDPARSHLTMALRPRGR
ncbi:hypothetical protein SAMN04488561_2540 [Jiangella alba]|uniref:Uncharacterized protein n=1 Tax=Jiangella alba TaxID=561176 RepID=A0A1H5LFM5_9ACTN|nr:hypothetical protein SAMN04488561_2540 [Jiangella alba]